jgi:PII-like signaling protein
MSDTPGMPGKGRTLRIFIGESDRWQHRSLADALLEMLRAEGIAGATVTRGIAGYGAHSRIHTAHILRLSEDLPIVIEAVDTPENIDGVLPRIQAMVREGLVVVFDVDVVLYRHRDGG